MFGRDTEDYSEVPDEVEVGDGTEGFPDRSKYPLVTAVGMTLLGFGLAWPSWLFTLLVGVPVATWGVGGWAVQYGVHDFEDDVIPEQKRQLLGAKSATVAMWLFVLSEFLLFAGLFLAYWFLSAQYGPWPPEGLPPLDAAYALGLTVILLASGATMHWSQQGMREGNRTQFNLGLAATLVLGSVFALGQAREYSHMFAEGITPWAGSYGSTFYLLTGTHGLHVLVGLTFLAVVGVRAWRLDHFHEDRHAWVTAATQYWHFVDAVWLLIVAFVYL
ncbi:MAG: heme-copper oxidase subunit III [Halobacteriaceae archaeon]